MIKDNKKLNPIVGILIGIFLIAFGAFGNMIILDALSVPIEENWGITLYFTLAMIFAIPGVFFLTMNANYFAIKRMAQSIHKRASVLNPETFIHPNFSVTKIRNWYVLKFNDRYLMFITMHDKKEYIPTWIRRVFLGPRGPTIVPLKNPVVSVFHGFKIRKSEGLTRMYDSGEDRWIKGESTVFCLSFFTKTMSEFFFSTTFLDMISTIDNLLDETKKKMGK